MEQNNVNISSFLFHSICLVTATLWRRVWKRVGMCDSLRILPEVSEIFGIWASPGWFHPANLIFHVEPSWLWPGMHQHIFPKMSPRLTPTLKIGTLSSTLIRSVLPYVHWPSVTTSRCKTEIILLQQHFCQHYLTNRHCFGLMLVVKRGTNRMY